MKKQEFLAIMKNGLIDENPTLRLVLGMCPTLAVSTAASRGLGMGLATTAVLIFSNLVIASIRNIIPEKVRIPAFVVVIATFVTMIDLLIKAFLPALSSSLGIYIPLIVVNCIVFARAESFAFKNPMLPSMVDGLAMGLGFTFAITLLSSLREIIGNGTLFDISVTPSSYIPMAIAVRPTGGFILLGVLLLIMNSVFKWIEKRTLVKEENA